MRITKEEVIKQAEYLKSLNITATASKIRERLGRGSFTTILNHLAEWRGDKGQTVRKKMKERILTPEMIKTINFLGDQFNAEGVAKREALLKEVTRKEKEIEAQNEELHTFEKNEDKFKKGIRDLQDTLAKKEMEIEKLEFRISEYEKEIDRLRKITDGFLIKAKEVILEKK